ncbi:Competence protein F homolog, phosphoribosyltransferase domain; protein YhgH required for utilization of DNA as sole source of carbon and energy [hydrothermal vent metagenome]|uniref:Competence protein F homolog, phosphoribosyltransferase domain protein YhgH required for utilization of DNA as sole source of carbon and energy n=1 Tax=hydrothermal vent metagenome TaxID=652676 RepID=A0A3B0ZQU7_9ZZZZ
MVHNCLKTIRNYLLPPICVTCGQEAEGALDLCQGCLSAMPYLGQACRQCALPLAESGVCGSCLKVPPPFEQAFSLFRYTHPVDHLIQQLKFNRRLVNARLLGALMAESLQQQEQRLPDLIVPVPLHRRRLQTRGYNQAVELARPVSKLLGVPLEFSCCHRTRETAVQSDLPAKQRRSNIKGAFEVGGVLSGKHVAVIDDVMTTGNTVTELAQVMRDSGVQKVDIWVCARVP